VEYVALFFSVCEKKIIINKNNARFSRFKYGIYRLILKTTLDFPDLNMEFIALFLN